jgi:hypothetical protein
MNLVLPNKSSSRSGRFKKKLVSENVLQEEGSKILSKVEPFLDLYQSKVISDVEFTASYILLFLSYRFPHTFLGAHKKSHMIPGKKWIDLPFNFDSKISNRLDKELSVLDLFAQFTFRSTPSSVNRAVVEWANGNYGLELMFRIPKPKEVLNQQILGRRCVTTIVDRRIETYILGERDSLSFTLHDLIHADHFYYHNECFEGQLGFYGLLHKFFDFFEFSNEKFCHEFEYLISDMNAYAIHLLKCLKSAMIHYFNEDYFIKWSKIIDAPSELNLLNTQHYLPEEMDREILNWLKTFIQAPLSVEKHR